MNVLNTNANTFARKYLLINPHDPEPPSPLNFFEEYYKCLGEMVEQLMFFDKITIKVYGENMPLIILINELGLKQVLELAEEGVIEFILWNSMVTHLVSDDLIGKVHPIQSGNVSSKVHCEPSESIRAGLQALTAKFDEKTTTDIVSKISSLYKLPNQTFAKDSVAIITSAYDSNKLADIGLPKEKDISFLIGEKRSKLAKAADDILETAILADFKLSSFGNYQYYDLSKKSFDEITRATDIFASAKKLSSVEQIPDIHQLLLARKIDLKELVKLRRKSTAKKYREWLVEHTSNDSEYIIKEYIDEIINRKGFFGTPKGKFVKTVGMYGIGGAVGALTGGIPGTVGGIAIATALNPVTDLGLSFIDTYLLDGLLKGWQPRMFINEYKKLLPEE